MDAACSSWATEAEAALRASSGQERLLLVLGAFALALFVLWRRERGRTGRENAARGRQGRRAEAGAERLLASLGYRVLERQLHQEWPLTIDGEPITATLRADLLVERDGRRYIAEVKSGAAGARPDAPDTRRQLLEYLLAFEVDGVLLVDMRARRVRRVEFPAVELG